MGSLQTLRKIYIHYFKTYTRYFSTCTLSDEKNVGVTQERPCHVMQGETLVRSIKEKRDKNMSFEEYGQDFTRWVKLSKNDKK